MKAIASMDGSKMTLSLESGEIVDADQVTFSVNEALIFNAISAMDISTKEANQLWQSYDGSTTAEAYASGISEAYHYGRMGVAYKSIDFRGYSASIPAQARKNAYQMGRRTLTTSKSEGYNNIESEKEREVDGTGENVHLRRGAQRDDRAGADRPVRRVGEAAGGVQNRQAAGRSEGNGRSTAKAEGRVNAADLGIQGGTGAKNLTAVRSDYSADTKEAVAAAAEQGLETVFFTGDNLHIEYNGSVINARACIVGKKIYVRADHPDFTALQLTRHEMAHEVFGNEPEEIRRGKIHVRKVYERLVDLCGTEEVVKDLIRMYAEAYDMGYDGTEEMAMEVFTEIVCDSEADMNAFAPEDRESTALFMEQIKHLSEETKPKQDIRGPPAEGARIQFSKDGYWIPNLTKQERQTVEHFIRTNRGETLSENTNLFFEQSKGNSLFGIYSTDDSTLLYASRGPTAEKEHLFVEMIREEYRNGSITDTSAKGLHTLAKSLRMQRAADYGNGDGVGSSRRSAGNGGVHGGPYGFKAGAALRNVLSNILQKETEGNGNRGVRPKFSREFIRSQMAEQEKQMEKVNKVLEKDNLKLQEDNAYLKQLLKLQKEVTGGTKFTKSSVEAMARQLKTKANASGDTKELSAILNSFYEFIATSKEIAWEDVMEHAQEATDWLMEHKRADFVRDEYAQRVLDDLWGRSFYLDDVQKGEAVYAYGSYQAFRHGEWKSLISRDGVWHKAASLIVIVVAFLADFIMGIMLPHIPVLNIEWPDVLAPLVLAWYIVTELGSILENAVKMGALVPGWIVKIFDATLKMIEKVGEEAHDNLDKAANEDSTEPVALPTEPSDDTKHNDA